MSDPQTIPQKLPFEETEYYRDLAQFYDEKLAEYLSVIQSWEDEQYRLLSHEYFEALRAVEIETYHRVRDVSLNRIRKVYEEYPDA